MEKKVTCQFPVKGQKVNIFSAAGDVGTAAAPQWAVSGHAVVCAKNMKTASDICPGQLCSVWNVIGLCSR